MTITGMMIIVIFVLLLIWTSISQKYGNPTISMTMRNWMWDWTVVSFVIGALIGHWSGSFFLKPLTSIWGYLIPFMGACFIFDLIWRWKKGSGVRHWVRYPIWYNLIGIICGLIFWGQR